MRFFATTAKNIEPLLLEELKVCGGQNLKGTHLGVHFQGELEVAYRACLFSRLAHHVFLELKTFEAKNREALYQAVKGIAWKEHLKTEGTFCINVSGKHETLTHPHFIAQIAKDAIVDQFRDQTGKRPNVQADRPDVVLQLHVRDTQFVLYLDLSGDSLHKRGIRTEAGAAPLKETLAAALLMRAGWDKCLQGDHTKPLLLCDPMCGAGTLLLEGAMMAYDVAAGLYRTYFGFLGWRGHKAEIWKTLIQEAKLRQQQALHKINIPLLGFDLHAGTLALAEANFRKLGLIKNIHLEKRDAAMLSHPLLKNHEGLIITNPPYGKRLMAGQMPELAALYARFGEALKQEAEGFQLAIFTQETEPLKALRLRPQKQYRLLNGPLECTLMTFKLDPQSYWR